MSIHVSNVISFVALLFYSGLLVIVVRRSNIDRSRLFFALYLLAMVVWSLSSFMIFSEFKIMDTLFWNRALVVGSMAMPACFLLFVVAFLKRRQRYWIIFSLGAYLAEQALNLSGQVITSAYVDKGALINEYGPGLAFVSTMWVIFLGSSTFLLVRSYRKSTDTTFSNRLLYLLLVVIITFTANLTNLTDLKSFPTDVGANILSAMLITFAIFRHRLLDISSVVRKGMLYSIPTVLIGASYYLIIQAVLQLFPFPNQIDIFFLSLTAAILTAIVMQPLRDKAQYLIDRLFFREKYDASLMLQRISHTATYELDLETLARTIIKEIAETLHIRRAALLIKLQEGGAYQLIAQKGYDEIANIRWAYNHPIALYLENHQEPLTREKLQKNTELEQFSDEEQKALEQLKAEMYIPLKAEGELVGVFILARKMSDDNFTDEDQLTLITLANQTAIAIEKARLFSAEQSRREELDVLYDLTRQLVVTNEVDAVIQSTTRHVVVSAHVTFARILTPDTNGGFYCRAAFPIRAIHYDLGAERFEPPSALPFYKLAMKATEPVFLNRGDPSVADDARRALMLDLANTLCMVPLRVGDQLLGLLILGERREANREPFDTEKMRLITAIADQAANALHRASLHEQMENTFVETVLALANAMDARDTYTSNHSQRISAMAEAVCREVNCTEDEIWAVHWAALLHDIGKIGVPDEILRRNGPLTPEEWIIMKRHPEIGARIVAPVKKLANVAPLIQAHHEWYNGNGYPKGIKGNEIPLGARILTIVDAYGAMTDDRVYRKPRKHSEAIAELRRQKGVQFDPELVEIFIRVLEREPPTRPVANLQVGQSLEGPT